MDHHYGVKRSVDPEIQSACHLREAFGVAESGSEPLRQIAGAKVDCQHQISN